METNVKVVGFANQSINGVTITNEGFDMEYDGKKLNMSGFSGDKLYYAKLNNQQLANLLNIPSSDIPLEERILSYKKSKKNYKKREKSKSTTNRKKTKSIKKKKSTTTESKKKSSSHSKYVTPKLRSEYRANTNTRHSKTSKRNSIKNTIY